MATRIKKRSSTSRKPVPDEHLALLPEEEVLDIHEIQGNILAGFNKDHQTLLFLNILKVEQAKQWLRTLMPLISTTAEVLTFNRLYKSLRSKQGREPVGLSSSWLNIAFSYQALRKMIPKDEENVDLFADNAFKTGLAANSAFLGDPQDTQDAGYVGNWVIGGGDPNGPDKTPDIVLIFAADQQQALQASIDRIKAQISSDGGTSSGVQIVFEQQGTVRADAPGHEHFGFKDGISQPGIRGRVSDRLQDFLTPRLVDPQKNPDEAKKFAKPGQPLIFPGQFVFGYGRQQNTDPLTPQQVTDAPSWAKNGSFLVFRRLRQDVKRFTEFVTQQAQVLAQQPAFQGITPDLLGAKLVGRWPSGAPLMRTPDKDIQGMANDPLTNNNFCYLPENVQAVTLLHGNKDKFPPQQNNYTPGTICPFAAHIQKVNPRDNDTDRGGEDDSLTRRILRRGIPFGPSYKEGEPDAVYPNDRGLLFLSYQTSIVEQFQVLSHDWANQADKPIQVDRSGQDPIIGQVSAAAGNSQDREFYFQLQDSAPHVLTLPASTTQWIIPTGGGYFFAPSIHTLSTVICSV